jgi:hypothetical protein
MSIPLTHPSSMHAETNEWRSFGDNKKSSCFKRAFNVSTFYEWTKYPTPALSNEWVASLNTN